ncbi:MAG: aconitase X swivel domain-containing protein [Bilifractor sp.]|jgi:predicted aconitase with swiveling domain
MYIKNFNTIVSGIASGEALVSKSAISFYGGVDPENGKIQDVYNNLFGSCITGKILCIPRSKGSCSGSTVVLELIRRGLSPAAILCLEAEPVLSLGALIGKKIYTHTMPILTISEKDFDSIRNGDLIKITEAGISIAESFLTF